jgi:erythromycin esterase
MLKHNLSLAIIAVIIILVPITSMAQHQALLTDAINNKLIPIKTLKPDGDFTDLQPLKEILKDKKIIGLGEATHGTHEFFVFKHHMLEFLVKEMGFKTFVIEASFTGTQTINDYVLYGKGNPYEGLSAMGFGIWMTDEFVQMAEWVKTYNQSQPIQNRVKFYGCDMQDGQTSTRLIKDYLTQSKQLTTEIEDGFKVMTKQWASITDDDKKGMKNTITLLKNIRLASADTDRVNLYNHDVRALEQFVIYINSNSKFYPSKSTEIRDWFMAENCAWIYNYTKCAKMMIWAHNEHVRKAKDNYNVTRMGMLLNAQFKDNYYAFGFGFGSGAIRAFDKDTGKYGSYDVPAINSSDNYDAAFARASSPDFILDLKTASADEGLKLFLNEQHYAYTVGAIFTDFKDTHRLLVRQKLAEAYDAIIFFRKTTAAIEIKR